MEMKKNTEFFKRFAKYGMGAWAVGWNPVAQRLVHRAMMKHVDFGGSTVLDLGGGDGELLFNCVVEGQSPKTYVSVDLIPELCEAGNERFEKLQTVVTQFITGEMLTVVSTLEDNAYDYVVSAGTLDIMETNSVEHWQFMKDVITQMYRVASKAIVLAIQSAGAKEKKMCEFYSDPSWFIREMIERFGFSVVLDHSFAPHYMVVVVYKREYSWRELHATMYNPPEKRGG